jgi:ABC-type nickel/cobalt efflux system permease component RcnA
LVRGVSLNAGSFALISDCDDLICGGVRHPFSDLAAAAGELSEVGALHSAVTTIESSVVFGASRQSQLSTAPETCVRWSSRQLTLVAGCIKRFNACDWWALLSFVSLALILGFSHSGGPGSAPSIDPSFLLAQSTLALFTAVALSARGAHPQQAQVWFGIAELRVHSGGASTRWKTQ